MKQLRLGEIKELFDHGITVRYITEKLQSCDANEDACVVMKSMEECDFDIMGIEEKGVAYGYVERSCLVTGPCRNYQHIFHPSELISESTPLIDLLPILRDAPRVFVIDRNRVSGIVTRGDLQKAPVRMLLFGLVTVLEMLLLRLVQVYYPRDSWQKFLKNVRLEAATKLQAERQARNEAIELGDCLQFCDKRDLVLKCLQARRHLGFESKQIGECILKSAEGLRNKLAHVQDLVSGSSWPQVIRVVMKIEALLERDEEIEIRG